MTANHITPTCDQHVIKRAFEVLTRCPSCPQMQQQELAQMRQRDANLTALAAIGPRKKRKMDSPGGAASGSEVRTQRTWRVEPGLHSEVLKD